MSNLSIYEVEKAQGTRYKAQERRHKSEQLFPCALYLSCPLYLVPCTFSNSGEVIVDKDGNAKLFESPVAALEFANEKMMEIIHRV